MKILYTAFKGKNNTAYQLVSRINSNSLFLTNSFAGLEKDISGVEAVYDTVFMFGIDKNLVDEIRIESCAFYNGELLNIAFELQPLERKLNDLKIQYTVSNKPTRYLCNAAYYHMLKKNPNTVFIHIPSLKGMTDILMNKLQRAF